MKRRFLILFFAIFTISSGSYGQFLHRDGKMIVDGNGQEVILRGMGLGGWMLQEGYMLEMSSFANPQHQIKARIKDVLGDVYTEEFYEAWLANHCTKTDIDSLASWGFNSVRLPMHYNLYTLPIEDEPVAGQDTWLDKGFAMTDSLLNWCEANQIYLILDLHAAPGGQGKDAAISDYDNTKPSLWESEENQRKTVALWRKLAERYANEQWIGGYDLINETNWNFQGANINGCNETVNAPLRKLFIDITNAIREVDDNHIIFIEGNCWANNHNGLFPLWDDNISVSFHKYWSNNDQGSVQGFINIRDNQNVPLWLGESGENSNVWFRNAIRLMEDNKIGWAWWPMKKFGSVVNPLTVVKTQGYENLLNYWKQTAPKPSVEEARTTLMQMAENLKIENNIYRKDVIDAMFRQVYDDATIPFKHHVAPGVVHATDFDLGRSRHAYFDKDTATYHVSGGSYTAWNSGWAYRNDGVDIESNNDTDPQANGYNVGWTNDGEWLQYTVDVDSSAAYNIEIRHTGGAAKVKILVNGVDRSPVVDLPSGGWANATINDVLLDKGLQKIRVYFSKGGANLSYLKFTMSKKTEEVNFQALAAETESDGLSLSISFNKTLDASTLSASGFSVTVNGNSVAVTEVTPVAGNNAATIKVDGELIDSDAITITYAGDAVKAADGSSLQGVTNLAVLNDLPHYDLLPAKIEAEDYVVNQGLQSENCNEGGLDMGYTNTGDYLEYLISVPYDTIYTIEARIACNASAGKLDFQQRSKTGEVLNSAILDVPVTGGWQNWQTVSTTMQMTAGNYILRLRIAQPEFNINWFKFSIPLVNGVDKKKGKGKINVYPNPTQGSLKLDLPDNVYGNDNSICIRQVDGKVVKRISRANREQIQSINIDGLPTGVYLIEVESKGSRWTNKFMIR